MSVFEINSTARRCFSLIAGLTLLAGAAKASYFGLTENTKEAQQCITYDVRYPYWTDSIYIATYPGHSRSKEGWIAPYYGGIVSNTRGKPNLIQYASWQMGGKGAPASGIDFVHAGPHMSWVRSTWEGSSGGIKGLWPTSEFKPKEWYRFVNRVWTPAKPVPHLGYAGVWMKNLTTGEWHHLATFKFPAELTGFDAMGGFCEYITGNATKTCAAEFRNIYAMRNDQWGAESVFTAFNHKEDIIKMTQTGNKSSVLLETTRTPQDAAGKYTVIPVVTEKVKLNQPEKPTFFDPVRISAPAATGIGGRCVVKWQVDPKASPQLGYIVDILDGTTVIATAAENDPDARLCVLEIANSAKNPQARIRITDIFGQVSQPVTIPIPLAVPLAARSTPAPLTAGLDYCYFESDRPDEWQAIPDMDKLKPKRSGVVAVPDLTPRLSRTGYAFRFDGFLTVPTTGLYAFNLISACGAKLILDDKTVIDADGYHSISRTPGAVALAAGRHKLSLPYYQGARQYQQSDDFLQLTWSGPGFTDQAVPFSAFSRDAAGAEPQVVLKAAQQGAAGINLLLSAEITPATTVIDRVEYYATNPGFDYYSAQGACGAEYFLTDSKTPATPTPAVIWGGGDKLIRARLIYNGNRTIDSAPLAIPDIPESGAGTHGPFQLTQLEHHLYPMACDADATSVTLVGESMGLLTKPLTGDGTIIARLADITSNKKQADGTELMDSQNWYAGLIIRNNLDARPGEPLGGSNIPYAAIMGAATRQTRYCDSTMINGAGNQPASAGDSNPWFKIERKGADITLSDSPDGTTWKVVKTVNLPKLSATTHIGFVIYSIPCATNRVHWARFDHISITP